MRVFILLLDGVGVGAQPDSDRFHDGGANTLRGVVRTTGVALPNLAHFGLLRFLKGEPAGLAAGGKLEQFSAGKDTTSGHWELMGVVASTSFPTYPNGFPEEVVSLFTEKSGLPVLGNKPASGTVIIEELGKEHIATGHPILYTSADSVFQLAAHEDVIPPQKLWDLCRMAREEVLIGDHAVGRVIARPFTGKPGAFVRTERRRDFSLPPPHPTLLEFLLKEGKRVVGIGKVDDIFAGRGFSECHRTKDNVDGLRRFREALKDPSVDFLFANLGQFDSHWGHRRDPAGFAQGLKDLDDALPAILDDLGSDDLFIMTADHGCDPSFRGSDHTREYVPCLFFGTIIRPAADFGIAPMTALADTLADMMKVKGWLPANSLTPIIT